MIPRKRTNWVWWLPWVLLSGFATMWFARWPLFPLVLDPYYHLLIAQQVHVAGGPISFEGWEYAPYGRPHLYPSLLHVLLAFGLQARLDPLTVIRIASVGLPILLLWSVWRVSSRLCGASAGLATVIASISSYAFYLHSAITLAATLGMIEWLWLVYAIEQRRMLSAGIWLALSWYTHLGMPWVALVTLIAVAIFRRERRQVIAASGWGLILALPWWMHLARAPTALIVTPRVENTMIELLPLLYLAALAGAWKCWRMGGAWLWWLGCWFGFLVLAPAHRYRWLSGEGLLPVMLLAGAGMHGLAQWLSRRSFDSHHGLPLTLLGTGWPWARSGFRPTGARKGSTGSAHGAPWRGSRRMKSGDQRRAVAIMLLLGLGLFASPSLVQGAKGWRWVWRDTAPWHLVGLADHAPKTIEASFYSPLMGELVEVVRRETQPREILWSNLPYALGVVAALAQRPMASAMLNEVAAARPSDPLDVARLIIWFKVAPFAGLPDRAQLAGRSLQLVAETSIAAVFRQGGARPIAPAPLSVIPLGAVGILLIVAGSMLWWDRTRSRQRASRSV